MAVYTTRRILSFCEKSMKTEKNSPFLWQKNSPRRLDAGGLDGESRDALGGGSSDRGLSPFSSVASLPIHPIEPMHELLQRLVLELPNPFARQA